MSPPAASRSLPNPERLSLLAATILLAYAMARFIQSPPVEWSWQLPGFYFAASLSLQGAVAYLVAGMTAAGTNWLLHDHPGMRRKQSVEHWVLPALTAWVIGLPLLQMPLSLVWWAGFALGGAALLLVLVAEYIVVDAGDERHALAAAGLTVVSFALYLVLAVSLRFAGLRLFLLLPVLAAAGYLVSLRALRLRLPERWPHLEAGLAALITLQLAAALHYWPLSPVAFGLALLAPSYAVTTLLGNLAEGEAPQQALIEPGVVLLILWGVALWMR